MSEKDTSCERTPDLREITAKNIAALRTSRKMTQLELGEALSYSDKAISKWERAEAVPDAYVLLDLARLFDVSVDWLLTAHEEKEQIPQGGGKRRRHLTITLLSVFGILSVATLAFVILAILGNPFWQVFVYQIPLIFIDLIVFNSLWGQPRKNVVLIAFLVASIVLTIYVACLPKVLWQLFLILAPAEIIVFLSRFLLRKK